MIGENIFQSLALTGTFAISFETIGRRTPLPPPPSASSAPPATFPSSTCRLVDGHAYTWHGVSGEFLSDALLGMLACILLLSFYAPSAARNPSWQKSHSNLHRPTHRPLRYIQSSPTHSFTHLNNSTCVSTEHRHLRLHSSTPSSVSHIRSTAPQRRPLLIQSEFDIQFHLAQPTPFIALLRLHPSVHQYITSSPTADARLHAEHLSPTNQLLAELPLDDYYDTFGNLCSRFVAPAGNLRLSTRSIVDLPDQPDPQPLNAYQAPIEELPAHTLQFLLPSRYCEVDLFNGIANDLFSDLPAGWPLATAIRDWVHQKIAFDYKKARPTMTAMDVFTERIGVCRDFQHLAVTLTRCMKIPARYVTGYIGDVRVPYSGPGDFSAWYQVWLDNQWWDIDARHNEPRYGRILIATGRDAADVAITTSFGNADLTHFYVDSLEIDSTGNRVPHPPKPESTS